MASKEKGPSQSEIVNILVSVDDLHVGQLNEVAGELRSAGMNVAETFPLSGTIAGEAPMNELHKLRQVDGVASVDEEPEFHASR